jgi:hypothetical protein
MQAIRSGRTQLVLAYMLFAVILLALVIAALALDPLSATLS